MTDLTRQPLLVWLLSHADLQANGQQVECLWCAPGDDGTTFTIAHIGELKVTEAMMATVIANFQRFDRSPPRVPIQVNHATDSGNMQESKAVGWVTDLSVRRTAQRVSLLFTPHWSDEAREVIAQGGFRYVSVGMHLNAVDPVSAESVGPKLCEVSLTNFPAIPNLAPLELSQPTACMDLESKAELTALRLARVVGPDGEPDMLDRARSIARAFYAAYPDTPSQEWMIKAVFFESRQMVVEECMRQVGGDVPSTATAERLWQLGFLADGSNYSFAARDTWTQVIERFVPMQVSASDRIQAGPMMPQTMSPMHSGNPNWDADAAMGRVRAWAMKDGKMQWGRYRQAFAWVDSNSPDTFGAYKLPHHDVEDGRLVVVRSGVVAANSAIQGGRGGVAIPDGDMPGVKRHMEAHCKQLDMKPPWANGTASAAAIPDHQAQPGGTGRPDHPDRTEDMDNLMKQLQALLKALGVDVELSAETADSVDLSTATKEVERLKGLETELAQTKAAAEQASKDAGKQLSDSERKVVSLSTRADAAEETVAKLSGRIATLESEKNQRESEAIIDLAIKSGRLLPAEVDTAERPMRKLALSDRATFQAIIDARPKMTTLTEEIGSAGGDPGTTKVDTDEFWTLVAAKKAADPNLNHQGAQDLVLAERPEFKALFKAATAAVRG